MKKLMNLIAVALCSICAQAVEFDYEVNWDGTIALTDVRGEIPKKLVIPSIYDGKEVTVIASHFLDGEDRLIPLESLVVSEGVLEIGHEAFADCPWLATVQLPASLKRVEEEAFSGGPDELVEESSFRWSSAVQYGLRQISVASGNQSIVVKDGVLIDVNQGLAIVCCVSAKSVSIPEGVTTIGEDCFAYCLNLETVEFPESLREVGEEAFVFCRSLKRLDFSNTRLRHVNWNCFCGCDSLREVRFPASLRQLGALSFCWCRSLAAVTFLGDAPEISDIDYDDDPGWRSVQANIYVTSNDDLSKPAFVSPHKFKASIMTGVTTYVSPESKGWGAIPGVWQGCPIQYIGSPVTPSIEHSYGPFVPGEKVSLMIPALVGYKAKKLPSGLKLNKKTGSITGAAKKPTGEAGVTVTFTKKNEPTLTAQFVVGPMPTINVTLEGDTEKCKVSGANKAYLVGKKVSLQAKAPKGTAFVGWFRDGEPWPSEEECLEPKIKYVMEAENLDLVARFKAEEVSVACDISAGCVVKEQVSFPVVVDCESGLKSVSAKKLPSGLKYNKKTGCIEGAAKKAGTYPFSLTVTTKAGSKVTQSFALVVGTSSEQKMPEWAVGTFEGYLLWKFVDDQWLDKITWTIRSDGHVMAVVSALDYYANVDVQTIDLGHLSVNRRGQLFVEAKYWDEPSVKLLFFVEKGDDSFAGKMTCHQVGRMARHGAYELRSVARQDVWGSHAMSFEEGMSLELNMEDLPYQEDTQFNDCKSKGWLTLNFKNDGMVDVFYRTAQVGDVVARGMSRLYPYAETKDRGVLATCIMILEPHNQYMTSFVLSLDFSIDVMRGDVDATDIVVVDNLLGTDTGPDFISAQSL